MPKAALTRESLEAYKRLLLEQLELTDSMIRNLDKVGGADVAESVTPMPTTSDTPVEHGAFKVVPGGSVSNISRSSRVSQPRVRGVLAAVKQIVQDLPGPFDKNDIIARLRERDSELAVNISPANLRNTLRLLAKSGYIQVQIDATSTSCAKYTKKRVAA